MRPLPWSCSPMVSWWQRAGSRIDGTHPGDFALARYLPDGRLDPTFGVGGKVSIDFGGCEEAYALVLQPDGKLVAAGISTGISVDDFALARYLPDGRLDPTFGVGGIVTTDFGSDRRSRAPWSCSPTANWSRQERSASSSPLPATLGWRAICPMAAWTPASATGAP